MNDMPAILPPASMEPRSCDRGKPGVWQGKYDVQLTLQWSRDHVIAESSMLAAFRREDSRFNGAAIM